MITKDDSSRWRDLITRNGLAIGEVELDKLIQYKYLLLEWNQRVNLVSRKDETNIWPNHILHSVSLLFNFDIPANAVVADIGSGGGLPGIPLAILLPSVNIVMIESIKKKCAALTDIVSRLEMENARVVNGRVEAISALNDFSHSFDVVFARAVASLKELVAWSKPLARNNSSLKIRERNMDSSIQAPCLVAMKGGDISAEIADAKISVQKIIVRNLRFDGIEKTALVDKKIVIVRL